LSKIIVFSNQKGGCAKTTTAIHLACYIASVQKKVHFVDADPQHSAATWLQLMKSPIPVSQLSDANELIEQIPELAQTTDFLVVDGAAGNSESSRAILFTADVAIVPVQPTGLDLHSALEAFRLVRQAQKIRGGLPKAAVFLSRAQKGTRLRSQALSALSQIPDVILLKTVIHQKQAIADCFTQGAVVWEMSGASDSAKEFDALCKEIIGLPT
jgi:chromosome partitioning protein